MSHEPDPDYIEATKLALEEYAAALAALEPPKQDAAASAAPEPPPKPAPTVSHAEQAQRLRDHGPAFYLAASSATLLGQGVDTQVWKLYFDDILQGLGSPTDPVARMMAEQLALAHHAVGRLLVRGASRTTDAEVTAFHASATRLMAEFRRTALALKAYREASPRREPDASPAGASAPAAGPTDRNEKEARQGKVASKNRIREHLDEHEPALA